MSDNIMFFVQYVLHLNVKQMCLSYDAAAVFHSLSHNTRELATLCRRPTITLPVGTSKAGAFSTAPATRANLSIMYL